MNENGMNETGMSESKCEVARNFFSDSRQVLDIAKHAQAQLDRRAATGFSVFDYFNERETDLSRVFAGLLDPAAMHGQGESFLRVFLEELQCQEKLQWSKKYTGLDLKSCEVECEYSTDERRRIDIVLKMGSCWIGIENKPWAGEQKNQVEDYLKFLQDKDREAYLCYFSGDGSDSTSAGEYKNKCRTVAYRKRGKKPSVEGWIERCLPVCEAENVRWFLKNLLKYIRCEFSSEGVPRIEYRGDVMNRSMVDFIVERAESNVENLDVAFQVACAMPEVKKRLIENFIKRIKHHVQKEKWCCCIGETENKEGTPFNPGEPYILLYKSEWALTDHGLPAAGAMLTAHKSTWEDVHLCVGAPNQYAEKYGENLREKLDKKFIYDGFQPKPAYYKYKENGDWSSLKFLTQILKEKQAEDLAKKFACELCELASTLDDMPEFKCIVPK